MALLNDPTSGVKKITWVFTRSPKTGKIGPSPRLREALEEAGINIEIRG
jgi:hypothetical protein